MMYHAGRDVQRHGRHVAGLSGQHPPCKAAAASSSATHGYDAVVCSHLFPMETLTFLRRTRSLPVRCYGVLSDYTCIPFLAETELDGYFLPHEDVRATASLPGCRRKS